MNHISINIQSEPESEEFSTETDEKIGSFPEPIRKHINYEIGYDYSKDRACNLELNNKFIIKNLFEDLLLDHPIILRGKWKKNKELRNGWLVPCFFCWTLTSRKISYLKKHIIYACKDCLPKNKLK